MLRTPPVTPGGALVELEPFAVPCVLLLQAVKPSPIVATAAVVARTFLMDAPLCRFVRIAPTVAPPISCRFPDVDPPVAGGGPPLRCSSAPVSGEPRRSGGIGRRASLRG